MILFSSDVPILPSKVYLISDKLYDESLGHSYPINQTGHFMISLINGKNTIHEISQKVAVKYNINEEVALQETINFFTNLTDNFVVNIIKKRSLKSRLKLSLGFLKILQYREILQLIDNKRRYDIPDAVRHPVLILFYLLIKIPFYHPLIYLVIPIMFMLAGETIYNSITFTFNIFLSVSIHEYAHILALYLLGEKSKLAFIGRKSFTIGVYRERLDPFKDIIVSLSGPIIPALIGFIILYSTYDYTMEFISFIWITNIFTLVIGTDGKNIFQSIKMLLMKRGSGNI